MFSALRKLRILEQQLEEGRFEDVLKLASDPAVRLHRRALTARGMARQRLLERAELLRAKGEVSDLERLVRVLVADGTGPDLIPFQSALEACRKDLEANERNQAQVHRQALEHLRLGRPDLALDLAERGLTGTDKLAQIREQVGRLKSEVQGHCQQGSICRDQNDLSGARTHLALALEGDRQSAEASALAESLLTKAEQLPMDALTETLRVIRQLTPKGARLQLSFERVSERHRRGIEDLLSQANFAAAGIALAIYPLGVEADVDAERWSAGLRALRRADKEWGAGNLEAAHQWLEKVQRALPASKELGSRCAALSRSRAEASDGLRAAREALNAGLVFEARERLLPLLEQQPRHPDVLEFLHVLDSHESEDLRVLSEIRAALVSSVASELLAAQKVLRTLRARRADLLELAVLERDLVRRIRECGAATSAQATPDELWGPCESSEASSPTPPLVLHVEESGDWLMLDRPRVVLGRYGGPADVPFLAPVAKIHACLRRREVGDDVVYDLIAGASSPSYRNQALVEGSVELRHGDIVALGSSVEFRFLRPVADNGTCVLELEGGRDVFGCRRILLLGGFGRQHAVVMGPGPASHLEGGGRPARVELIREQAGDGGVNWIARCVSGVSVAGGPERPQVRVGQGERVSGGSLAFHLSAVTALKP